MRGRGTGLLAIGLGSLLALPARADCNNIDDQTLVLPMTGGAIDRPAEWSGKLAVLGHPKATATLLVATWRSPDGVPHRCTVPLGSSEDACADVLGSTCGDLHQRYVQQPRLELYDLPPKQTALDRKAAALATQKAAKANEAAAEATLQQAVAALAKKPEDKALATAVVDASKQVDTALKNTVKASAEVDKADKALGTSLTTSPRRLAAWSISHGLPREHHLVSVHDLTATGGGVTLPVRTTIRPSEGPTHLQLRDHPGPPCEATIRDGALQIERRLCPRFFALRPSDHWSAGTDTVELSYSLAPASARSDAFKTRKSIYLPIRAPTDRSESARVWLAIGDEPWQAATPYCRETEVGGRGYGWRCQLDTPRRRSIGWYEAYGLKRRSNGAFAGWARGRASPPIRIRAQALVEDSLARVPDSSNQVVEWTYPLQERLDDAPWCTPGTAALPLYLVCIDAKRGHAQHVHQGLVEPLGRHPRYDSLGLPSNVPIRVLVHHDDDRTFRVTSPGTSRIIDAPVVDPFSESTGGPDPKAPTAADFGVRAATPKSVTSRYWLSPQAYSRKTPVSWVGVQDIEDRADTVVEIPLLAEYVGAVRFGGGVSVTPWSSEVVTTNTVSVRSPTFVRADLWAGYTAFFKRRTYHDVKGLNLRGGVYAGISALGVTDRQVQPFGGLAMGLDLEIAKDAAFVVGGAVLRQGPQGEDARARYAPGLVFMLNLTPRVLRVPQAVASVVEPMPVLVPKDAQPAPTATPADTSDGDANDKGEPK
jgi:hypothetical protein